MLLLISAAILVVVLVVMLAKFAASILELRDPPRVVFVPRPRPGRPSRRTAPQLFLLHGGRLIPAPLKDWIEAINAMPEGPAKDEAWRLFDRALNPVPATNPSPESRRSQLTFLLVLAIAMASFGVLLRISW
jgi:hypothetical protein